MRLWNQLFLWDLNYVIGSTIYRNNHFNIYLGYLSDENWGLRVRIFNWLVIVFTCWLKHVKETILHVNMSTITAVMKLGQHNFLCSVLSLQDDAYTKKFAMTCPNIPEQVQLWISSTVNNVRDCNMQKGSTLSWYEEINVKILL